MRQKLFILTIAVAAMLSSCRRHESLLTGSYGEQVVAGQVVMASEMANSSPTGVEVSVVGTGMSAILAADGRFTFAGVPANAELAFRRADGIDARMRVTSSAPLVVELSNKTAASKGGRRRGVSPKDPGPSQEIEGVIQTPGTDSIVVLDSHKQTVTIAVTSATLIRKGNQTVKAGDLKVGDRVHVKALMADGKLTASQIVVQDAEGDDDGNGKQEQEVEGKIVTVSATSLTVHDSHGQDVVMAIDSSTVIRKGNQTLTAADLKAGDRVHVKTLMVDGKLTASQIVVQDAEGDDDGNGKQEQEVEGKIVTVSATSLTVHDSHGQDVVMAIDSSTVIRKGSQTLTAADLKTDDHVHVRAGMVNGVLTALQIIVQQGDDND